MFRRAKIAPYEAGRMKKRRLSDPARKILLSVVIMLGLFIVAGVVYTWLVGRNANVDDSAEVATENTLDPIITPSKPAPDATIGAAVHALTTPVKPGENASITVKSNADATCTIKVVYGKVASTDSGLGPKVADKYGDVSWSWTVSNTAAVGKWPIQVDCANAGGKSAMVQGVQEVKK